MKEVEFCDHCKKESDYPKTCISCRKEFCWVCSEKIGICYQTQMYVIASSDSFYCNKCDERLKKSQKSERHNLLVALKTEMVNYDTVCKLARDSVKIIETALEK